MKELIFECPSCSQRIQCDSSHAGEKVPCPSCATLIRVPLGNAIAEIEVPTPQDVPQAKPETVPDDPFNNAAGSPEKVSYTPVKPPDATVAADGIAEPAAAPDAGEPAPEPVHAPTSPEPEPSMPVTAAAVVPHDIYCICPACEAELRLRADSLPQTPGALAPADVVRPSPSKPATPVPPSTPAVPSAADASGADALDRERQIATARENLRIQANPTVKPRLSYILTGGQAPAPEDNNSVHAPVPQPKPDDVPGVKSLTE